MNPIRDINHLGRKAFMLRRINILGLITDKLK
jgi:hypothetical protein